MTAEIPRTQVAEAAAALAAEACAPFLLNHSYRTYLFGRSIVTDDMDDEAAFVASMIHDIGLTEAHAGAAGFDEVGADVAARFLESRGWDADRIKLVEQAILRHTELVPHDVPELLVVQAGAALDVVGVPPEALEAETTRAILASYPRLDFREGIMEAFRIEVDKVPDGAFARLERDIGISRLVLDHPFDRS